MKIQLEQKLSTCPEKMTCIVCCHSFQVNNIRTLIYDNQNLIQGDICPKCLKLNSRVIQQKLRYHADYLMHESTAHPAQRDRLCKRALELLAVSEESVKFPTFLQWLWKKMEILSLETEELDVSRLGVSPYDCEIRTQLQNLFTDDKFCQ
jgi:hypothetical protein